ncbi:MAG TPA: hypothetical protein ENF48_04185 [Desulfobacteraceae bacterium]|nr:hypothetical protein [Deltaproteobacteria bacterium]HDI59548.1 hypothetical protein [Desulfobacteraceae bacterium]
MKTETKQVLDLADEFLVEVAGSFFGARCKLDAMIEAFEGAVARLRREAGRVAAAAAALGTVLIDAAAVEALFQRLGVDPRPFTATAGKAPRPRIRVPFLWGRRRRYRAVVAEAYRDLAAAVARYRDGEPEASVSGDDGDHPVYYRLVEEMARLINDRIEAVNRNCVPSEMLQYVKQFDPAKIEREGITGGGGGNCGLDERLCYKPLDFDSLDLPSFPILPSAEQARETLRQSADAVYRAHPEAVARLLEGLKKRQANRRPASGPGAKP